MQQYYSDSDTAATDASDDDELGHADEFATNNHTLDDAQQQLLRKRKREEQALDEEVAELRAELQDDEDAMLGAAAQTPTHQAQRLLDLQAAELLASMAVDDGTVSRAEQLLRALHSKLAAGMAHGVLDYSAARGFCKDVGVIGKVGRPCGSGGMQHRDGIPHTLFFSIHSCHSYTTLFPLHITH